MTRERVAYAVALAALVLLGFYWMPGRTFLQSDTQIYIPILERFRDPSLYPGDPVAMRPHVTYSIYDEMALLLRKVTGASSFEPVLLGQQLATRLCGYLGAFLIGRAFGLAGPLALLVAAIYGLGATITGPAVLTLEYEPVPRGYAICLLLLATGLGANGRLMGAAVAAGVAFLYHPPTTLPFLLVFGWLLARRREWRPAVVFAAFAGAAFLLSRMQIGESEPQALFERVGPELEKLQRLRGAYNWVSMWGAQWLRHYEFLFLFAMAAWWRWRGEASREAQAFLFGFVAYGLASIGLSLALLEGARWSLMPAFQPARATAFLVTAACLLSACGGLLAASRGHWCRGALWLSVGYALPISYEALQVLLPDLRSALVAKRFVLMIGFSFLAAGAAWLVGRRSVLRFPALLAAAVLPFLLIPTWGEVKNYPQLEWETVDSLAAWARESTPKEATFLFADSGKDPYPSIFRAKSLRPVYVDWKGGGQVNLLRNFADEWWRRWQFAMEPPFGPERVPELAQAGITHLVLRKEMAGQEAVWRNGTYWVYRIR